MATWTPRQRQYILWLAAPSAVRPKGLRKKHDLATRLHLSTATLREWEVLPGFWDAVFAKARSIIGHELGNILIAMVREARGGSVQAAKLCLQILGVHSDKIKHEVDIHQDQLILIMHPNAPQTQLLPQRHVLQLPQSNTASVTTGKPATILIDD